MNEKKCFLYLFCLLLLCNFVKIKGQTDYERMRKLYDNFDKNDGSAIPYIKKYLQKAQQEKNYKEIKNAYEDYSSYSPNTVSKLKYADSAIVIAKKTNDKDLISSAYLYKGSLHYFYDKNYRAALDEYLQAYQYSKNSGDTYLKFKVIYQMGLVKSYLGYYEEALEHFRECIIYFEPKTKQKNHPNEVYNDSKGYLNSLHQTIVCYQHLINYKNADSLINIGFDFIGNSKDFTSEKNYFTKSKGISAYYHKDYKSAIENLRKVLPLLQKNDDVYWISVSDFYLGKSFLKTDREELAIKQFEKVDSIFKKRAFIFPELQENYDLLISYSQKKNELQKELAYTKDLTKINNILQQDFPKLSTKIHKNYDKELLIDAKSKVERLSLGTIAILTTIVIFLLFGISRYYRNMKQVKENYTELEKKLLQKDEKQQNSISYEHISTQSKSIISEEVFTDIQTKLKVFEDTHKFKENNLTVDQLAETFSTNKSYLSKYINDTKGMNFSKYIANLRINYITQLIYNDPKYLLLNIQGLAEECGISSRTNFSNLFQEINGIRPTDFIKQRKKELEENEIP